MKKIWLLVSLVFMSLGLQACGGGGPSVTHLGVVVTGSTTAGTAFSVTINALDSNGNVVASYMGSVQITSSDPQAILPGNTTLASGTAIVQITLKTAGNQTIMVSDATHRLSGSGPVSVSAAQLSQLSVTSLPASIAAGTAFNISVNATDPFSNVVASYTGTVHFTSTDNQAVLPSDKMLQNGTGSFSVTLKTAGTQIITATDTANPGLTGASGTLVNSGPVAGISVMAPPAVTTNLAFMVTVSAIDNFGNPVPSYTGTVKFTSSDAQATLPMNSSLTSGTGTFSVALVSLGPQTVTAADTVMAPLKGTSGTISVVTNAATHLSVTGPTSSLTRQTIKMTVTALDAANNTSVGYAGTVHFTSSDAQAKLPANSTLTMGTGDFSVTFETAGTDVVTATDTTKSSITGMASVTVTTAADLTIKSGNPPNGTVGQRYDPHFITICNIFRVCQQVKVFGFPLTASGGVSPYTWSWAAAAGSSLPSGLNVANPFSSNCPNGLFVRPACIYGTPTQPGTFNVVVTVTDGGSPSVQASANYTINIALPPPPVVNATPAPPPRGENLPYSFTFTAAGYPPFTWSESGALPTGLMLDSSTGKLSGTPTQTGSFPIMLTATDQFNQMSAAASFTIVITQHGFAATGSMTSARRFHTATLLNTGKVLVAGGEDGSTAFSSAELYDPATGMFTPTTHNMTVARAGHTATLLNNGKVLITGGATDATEAATDSAELYDPATDTFTATSGAMMAARVDHTATLLQSGKVLLAGGDVIFFNGQQNAGIMSLASAEIFDPGTGTFAKTGNMTVPRESHTATLFTSGPDAGKVLIAGGSNGTAGNTTPSATAYATSELFNPATGTFTAAGMMSTQRDLQTANLLSNGKVLVAGGISNNGTNASADLFDPNSGSFAATGNMTEARYYQDASTQTDGTVLITGGSDDNVRAKSTAEIYDPTAGTFGVTGAMVSPRVWHSSTALPNGKILIIGGADASSTPLATAELYQ